MHSFRAVRSLLSLNPSQDLRPDQEAHRRATSCNLTLRPCSSYALSWPRGRIASTPSRPSRTGLAKNASRGCTCDCAAGVGFRVRATTASCHG